MLTQFFLVSGYAFWIVAAAILVLDAILLATENDNDGWAVFITLAGLVGAALFTDAFEGVRLAYFVVGIVAYLAIGVVWSFKKWYSFVVETLADLRAKYNKPNYINKTASGNETFESYAKEHRPTAADNKSRITGWMALWPFSFTWWVLTWPRHAFVWLYNRLSTVFDRISAKVWASAS
jgi:hypothetical protein